MPTKEQELIICEMEKQAGETLESMVDSADMDKVAVKTQLLQNTNVVMTGVGGTILVIDGFIYPILNLLLLATVPISPQPPSRDDRFV